jgi:cysteine desulfurase
MIYLDFNATGPLAPEARRAMVDALDVFGNPSSAYGSGRAARAAMESARRTIAEVIGVEPREVTFTSGATESNNTALFGGVDPMRRDRLVLTAIEHSSVTEPARELERRGTRLHWLPLGAHGRIEPRDVAAAIDAGAALVSVGWANNEIGTVQDLDAISAVCRAGQAMLHTDAVQAFGRIATRLPNADLVSVSSHKIGGPKGIGALVRRRGVPVRPFLFGGAQERGLRAGTENVAAACGFAAAVAAAASPRCSVALRERLWHGVSDIPGVVRHSPAEACLPNTLLLGFADIRGEAVVAALDLEGVSVSVGSACAAGSGEPSHVLLALGCDEDTSRGGVRFSTGPATTAAEIDSVIAIVHEVIARMRSVPRAAAGGGR